MPDKLTDGRNLRLEKLAQALRATDGFANDHDYIAHVRPVDVREAFRVIAELREENERLKAELRTALIDNEEMYHAILDRVIN